MKYAKLFKDFLKDLAHKTELGSIYVHLFALLSEEGIERMLKEYYKISRGQEPAYGEYGKTEWFAIWHKSIRQCDFFIGCYQKSIKRILTGEERVRMHELKAVFYDKAIPAEEREIIKEERKEEHREYLGYFTKSMEEQRADNIGGHLDMLLWNTVYVDKDNELHKIFQRVFLEMDAKAKQTK